LKATNGTQRLTVATILALCLTGLPLAVAGAAAPAPAQSRLVPLPSTGVNAQNVNAQTKENTPVAIDVLSGDSVSGGLSSDSLHVQSVTQPSDGSAKINANNTVTYSPDSGFTGSDSFQYTAADETGLLTGTGTVHVTVNPTTTTTTTTSTTQTSTVTSMTSTTTSTSSSTHSSTTESTTTSTTSSTPSTTTTTTTSTSSSVGGTSELTVNSQMTTGATMTGLYTVLYQNSSSCDDNCAVATGYTPAQFTVNNGQTYMVEVDDYSSYYFQYWQDTGSVNANRTVTTDSDLSLTAVICDGPPGTCADPTPVDGITVYAHRIAASYWDPCFATACSAGTGPGASMYFELLNSAGTMIAGAFANEQGWTFSGLSPNTTYYVYATSCDDCHGADHDVVFQYWGDNSSTTNPLEASSGASLNAYYSCTNDCSGASAESASPVPVTAVAASVVAANLLLMGVIVTTVVQRRVAIPAGRPDV
jgi:hypothetical protein